MEGASSDDHARGNESEVFDGWEKAFGGQKGGGAKATQKKAAPSKKATAKKKEKK